MSFIFRLSLLCNISFLLMICLRYISIRSSASDTIEGSLGYQPIVATILILGYCAFFLNVLLCSIGLLFIIRKKNLPIPRWLQWSSILFLGVQVFYFFGGV
jgi:hypothetical protein